MIDVLKFMSNREIKFRAWIPSVEAMGMVVNLNGSNRTDYDEKMWSSIQAECHVNGTQQFYSTSEFILMQFTGFQDASGIDLYDGDLLSLSETKYTYEIRWEHGAWVCYHWNTSFESRWGPLSRFFDPDFSKYYINRIGNIHQNPKS